jgi:hypothetical protein
LALHPSLLFLPSRRPHSATLNSRCQPPASPSRLPSRLAASTCPADVPPRPSCVRRQATHRYPDRVAVVLVGRGTEMKIARLRRRRDDKSSQPPNVFSLARFFLNQSAERQSSLEVQNVVILGWLHLLFHVPTPDATNPAMVPERRCSTTTTTNPLPARGGFDSAPSEHVAGWPPDGCDGA